MPVCFSLYPIGKNEPAVLQQIDDAMRIALKQPEDKDHYLFGWFNVIGFRLALGETYEQIEQWLDGECLIAPTDGDLVWWSDLRDALSFLQKHYTPNCWREVGK